MPKPKLVCADFAFPLLSHCRSLQLTSSLDFKGVDIGLFEGRSHLWPSHEFQHVGRSGRKLGRQLEDLGLRTADVFLQMAPDFVPYAINHPLTRRRRKARDWFLKTLDYAMECGSNHVTVLPGAIFDGVRRRASYALMLEELPWSLDQAQSGHLTFAVEAHLGSIVSTPKAAARLVSDLPRLTLTLDYTHFTRAGFPDAAIKPLLQSASHFHVRGARRGRLQESFAKNTIDYRQVFKHMTASNYRGWIGIEYVLSGNAAMNATISPKPSYSVIFSSAALQKNS